MLIRMLKTRNVIAHDGSMIAYKDQVLSLPKDEAIKLVDHGEAVLSMPKVK